MLHSFNGSNGRNPNVGLYRDTAGNLYGTTNRGGASDLGVVFKITYPYFVLLHSFNGFNGSYPTSGVIRDSAGNLYGTTDRGGPLGYYDDGTVFKLNTAGALTTLVQFNGTNGLIPRGGVIRDSAGNLYGTTNGGGASNLGTVFKVSATGLLTTLHSFTSGANGSGPSAGVIRDSAGNLYGTTLFGGAYDQGTVFTLNTASALTTLVNFDGTNGSNPNAGLYRDSVGNLYGTMTFGGAFGFWGGGTVFKISATGLLTTLHDFTGGLDGAFPSGGVIRDSAGNLYGTTTYEGGTVFKLNTAGALTTLLDFDGTNGASPNGGLLRDSAGNLYGTTQDGGASNLGTVFKLNTAGVLTTLVHFNGTNGESPEAGLYRDSAGNLYGTTDLGGAFGYGTIFVLLF